MNTNQKKLKLVKEGIKASTLNKMTDSQIDVLFSKLQEQVTPVTEPAKTAYKVGEKGGNLPATPKGYNVKKNPDGTFMAMPNEQTEVDKDDENKGEVSQDPVQVQGPDGMDDDSDKELQEKFESKKQQKYFFAKCGDGKTKEQKKWCKMADEFAKDTNFAKLPEKKKETKESYQDMIGGALNKIAMSKLGEIKPTVTMGESEIEKQIMRLVEKHITPKMKKEDLLSLIEGDTKTAPAKPKVKPGTKPKHPFQPDPEKKGAPKAKKRVMDEDTKTAPAKPKVSPGTKPKHPFQPDPDKQGAPKAIKRELPSFLTFNALGLNKK
jgi:hypothetical protein